MILGIEYQLWNMGGISYGIMGYTTNMYTIHVMNGG